MERSKSEGWRRHEFTRRAVFAGGLQLGLFGILGGRLYYLQVNQSDRYSALAEQNRINTVLLAPERGLILDRNGVELASSRENFRVVLVPEQAGDVPQALQRLNSFIRLRDAALRRVLESARRLPSFVAIPVVEGLSWGEFAEINLRAPELPGIHCEVGRLRYYPHADALAHVVGYVAPVRKEDIEDNSDSLLRIPEFRIGRSGVETRFDTYLRGVAGASRVEVNAAGRIVRELERHEGQSGTEVALSLDLPTQLHLNELLKDESAAGVVMDVHSGEILAMSSTPSYDPNHFSMGIPDERWKALMRDPDTPFLHKAIEGQYAPGSTFKLVVALAALEEGVVNTDETYYCSGKYSLGTRDFHCWKEHGHGRLDMLGAIMRSCDVYFYNLVQHVPVEKIAAMARRMGFGEKFDIGIPGGKAGLVPSPQWKREALGENWYGGEDLITAVGQGYLLTTPLQLAVMAARIANGGQAVSPHIIKRVGDEHITHTSAPPMGLSPSSLKFIQDSMHAVSNIPGGTAYGSRIIEPSMRLAGKTGTTQVRNISRQERRSGVIKNEHLARKLRDHALFVAYAPWNSPRYAVSIVVEHGGSGSRAAAPPARDILQFLLNRKRQGAV